VTDGEAASYLADFAWLSDGSVAASVAIDVRDGLIANVQPGESPDGRQRLPGIVLPGFANAHSHAFHRALRGRTHDRGGTFWTWRERMYEVAARLTPDSYLALATATYAEMALAGVTCVGEFHYLHHQPDGTPYADPNVMAEALREAARHAGIRLTLLDACYLHGGVGQPLSGTQLRFGDGSADAWAERVATLRPDPQTRIGVAVHSVRAVRPADIDVAITTAESLGGVPVHAHVSEQPAENEACLAAFGATPTRLLADHGAVHDRFTAVHATHVTADDVALLGSARSYACFCPTTERDLADGIGPARALHDSGARLTLGSDQHAIIDLVEEARAMEMHERLSTRERGRFTASQLVNALTVDGHASLGWPEAGRLAPGAPADLVAIRLDSVRTAGVDPGQVMFAATAADVDTVIVGGRPIVHASRHHLGDVGRLLGVAIGAIYGTTGGRFRLVP
jgi:formiminoglutamate deiminase